MWKGQRACRLGQETQEQKAFPDPPQIQAPPQHPHGEGQQYRWGTEGSPYSPPPFANPPPNGPNVSPPGAINNPLPTAPVEQAPR